MALEIIVADPVDNLVSPEAEQDTCRPRSRTAICPDRRCAGDIARARGMTHVAREAGISRETLYKALRPEGNPTLDTLARVIRVLGMKLAVRQAA